MRLLYNVAPESIVDMVFWRLLRTYKTCRKPSLRTKMNSGNLVWSPLDPNSLIISLHLLRYLWIMMSFSRLAHNSWWGKQLLNSTMLCFGQLTSRLLNGLLEFSKCQLIWEAILMRELKLTCPWSYGSPIASLLMSLTKEHHWTIFNLLKLWNTYLFYPWISSSSTVTIYF